MKMAAVLVVDSNTNGLASLVEPLRKAGYRAIGAASFETARNLLHTQWYDLLITDLRLAAYNGLHLVFHSRVVNPAATAIIVAAIADDSSEVEARRLGAHYVARPVNPESLLALVGTVLEEAQYPLTSPSLDPAWLPRQHRERLPFGVGSALGRASGLQRSSRGCSRSSSSDNRTGIALNRWNGMWHSCLRRKLRKRL